jgi:regulation of enolase protein 1 (concanavalin A-like superfamily)
MRLLAFALGCWLTACLALAAPIPKPKGELFYKPGWDSPVDPDKDCRFTKRPGSLTIEIPGKPHDFEYQKRTNAPRLLRDVRGDFRLEVRVSARWRPSRDAHEAASLVVFGGDDERNVLQVEVGREHEEGRPRMYTRTVHRYQKTIRNGEAASLVSGASSGRQEEGSDGYPLARGASAAYLRLEREGDRWRACFSSDGEKWSSHTITVKDSLTLPATVKVGVMACSTSKGRLQVTFDQFKLTPLKPKAK